MKKQWNLEGLIEAIWREIELYFITSVSFVLKELFNFHVRYAIRSVNHC